jgi:hypothetical protein
MSEATEALIASAINGAHEVEETLPAQEADDKPRLLVEPCSPDHTVAALRDLFAREGGLFDRGVPVRLVADQMQGGMTAQVMAPIWWQRHESRPVPIRDIHDDVRQAADPQGRGRQFLASWLERLVGTRMAGFVLTRQAPVGAWGAATYALQRTSVAEEHREHREHQVDEPPLDRFDAPDPPYADGAPGANGHAEAPARAPMPPMPPCLPMTRPNRRRRRAIVRAGACGCERRRGPVHGASGRPQN